MIKKLLNKLDRDAFELVELVIMAGVRRSKYKKNKYFILAKMEAILHGLAIVAIIIDSIGDFMTSEAPITTAIINGVLVAIWSAFAVASYFQIKRIAEDYEEIFRMQSCHKIYKGIKEGYEILFKDDKKKRGKTLFLSLLLFGFIIFFGIVFSSPFFVIALTLWSLPTPMMVYSTYIFDFKPPKNKKKETEEAEMTELEKRSWLDAIKDLQPKPLGL